MGCNTELCLTFNGAGFAPAAPAAAAAAGAAAADAAAEKVKTTHKIYHNSIRGCQGF